MQAEEIEECLWMPVDQYLGSEETSVFNRSIVKAAVESHGIVPTSIDGSEGPETREFFMPDNFPG